MKTNFLKMSLAMFISWIMIGQIGAQMGKMRMLDSIPGITKEQKIKIATLQVTNRIEMQELSDKRKNASTWDDIDKLDRQLLEKRIESRNSVRNVLNDSQKKYFDSNFQKQKDKKFGKRMGKNKGMEKGMRKGMRKGIGEGTGEFPRNKGEHNRGFDRN